MPGPVTLALKARLEAMPGVRGDPFTPPRGAAPLVVMFKVMGKIFAILEMRESQGVILKCDPHVAEILREQYEGVGHKSHLDRRFWIHVRLDTDVPEAEIERLVAQSYDLVRAGLTKKQRAELETEGGDPPGS